MMMPKVAIAAALPMAALLLLNGIGGLARAQAHSWYPQVCCNDKDCRTVDKVELATRRCGTVSCGIDHGDRAQTFQAHALSG